MDDDHIDTGRRGFLRGAGALGLAAATPALAAPAPAGRYEDHDAIELARLIRDGQLTPVEVLESAIARAEACAPLNAVALRHDEQARERAPRPVPRRAGRASGLAAAGRRALWPEGSAGRPQGQRDHPRQRVLPRRRGGSRFDAGAALPGGWAQHLRQVHLAGIRSDRHHRVASLRRHPQPLEPGPQRRRVFRWLGGGRGGGHRAGGPRQRRRRLDPHPRQPLRRVRAQAQPRPGADGPPGPWRAGWACRCTT